MENVSLAKIIFTCCLFKSFQVFFIAQGYENSIIGTSLMTNISALRNTHVNIMPGTPYDIQPHYNITFNTFPLDRFSANLRSIAVDYFRRRLYMYDANVGTIFVVKGFDWQSDFRNTTLEIVHDGVSRDHVRLALDWVSNNIYWTDGLYGWIKVQSGRNSSIHKILLQDNLQKPFALAVDPLNRFLFWSDVGSTPKIERSSLTGQDRRTIISTGLLYPTNIDVDLISGRIVWIDAARDTIETASFDGIDRRVIKRLLHTEFYDVAVFRDMVCVTDSSNGTLYIINQNTDAYVTARLVSGEPFCAVEIYSAEVQPQRADDCASNGCSDLCFNEQSGPICTCRDGFKLNEDRKTCSEDTGQFHRALVWSNRTNVCLMDIRILTTSNHLNTAQCIVSDGIQLKYFDIDMKDRNIIYSDGSVIYSAAFGRAFSKQILVSATSEITGLAVNWRDNNVYWCTSGSSGSIGLVSQETLQVFVLLTSDLVNPRKLYILPLNNTMLWISGNYNTFKIEKAGLDCSDRKTIVFSERLTNPTSLTADILTNTVYFTDGFSIKQCDLDGRNLITINILYTSPLHLLLYKNYLIVADRDYPVNYIKTYDKFNKTFLYQFSGLNVQQITDMKILDNEALQPESLGLCDIFNGHCEHICILTGRNKTCICEYGYTLDDNKETCSSVPLLDNFLLVTDWTHNKIYQVSLVSDDVRALDTKTYGRPMGVIYNHDIQTVIWTTETAIHSLNIQSKHYKVLYNTDHIGCRADRLAIDYTSGNIYFTAVNTTIFGFLGIGVISQDGLLKRIIIGGFKPKAIVVDPENGLLFWTDHGEQSSFVKRADMDGTNVQIILSTGLKSPNGLTTDTRENFLYVTDGFTDILYRCTYLGACVQYFMERRAQLMDIVLLGEYFYYTAWEKLFVTKLNKKNNANVITLLARAEIGRLDSLSGYSSTAIIHSVSSVCLPNNGHGPCSTFCLPTVVGYTCACEDGYGLQSDETTCQYVNLTSVTTTITMTTTTTPITPSTRTSTTTPSTTTSTLRTTTTVNATSSTRNITTSSTAITSTSQRTSSTSPRTTTTTTPRTQITTFTSRTTPSNSTVTTETTTSYSNKTTSLLLSTTTTITSLSMTSATVTPGKTTSILTQNETTSVTTLSAMITSTVSISANTSITNTKYPESFQTTSEEQLDKQLPTATIAGGTVGFVLIAFIIIIVLVIIRKRYKMNVDQSAYQQEMDIASLYHTHSSPDASSEPEPPEFSYETHSRSVATSETERSESPYDTICNLYTLGEGANETSTYADISQPPRPCEESNDYLIPVSRQPRLPTHMC